MDRVLSLVLSSLFAICLLEMSALIVAEQHSLLKITLISVQSKQDAFFSPAGWYGRLLV